jgi:inner membrane protein
MATIISHPLIPLTIGLIASRSTLPWRLVVLGMLCAIVPDFDVVGFQLHVDYASPYGHRGFTHSIAFAIALACFSSIFAPQLKAKRIDVLLFIFAATISHALLDAMTTGGLGVALLWPFNDQRFFLPFQFIQVSPIGVKNFLTDRGFEVILSELRFIWLPCFALVLTLSLIRTLFTRLFKNPNNTFN